MLVTGKLENVPLLDVVQVIAHAKQSGILSVEGKEVQGSVLFEGGGIVCAESTSSRLLVQRAASGTKKEARAALRRVGALAALTELLALGVGVFRFRRIDAPITELAGMAMRRFYDAGPMDTGELLLAYATAIVEKEESRSARPGPTPPVDAESTERERARAQVRFSPTLIPAVIEEGEEGQEGEEGAAKLAGHLTNVSEGGAFFHGIELPRNGASCRVRFSLPGAYGLVDAAIRVAWVRADGSTARRGAGLAFSEMTDDNRGRLLAYLQHYQRLADEYRTGVEGFSPAATPGNLLR
jgi:hypothetical protein